MTTLTMRISHKHKFIFFAIPKTGSTTIRKCLDIYSDVIAIGDVESPLYWHVKPPVLKKYFEEQHWNWNEYFKFAFVRNPWDHVVSMYAYRSRLGKAGSFYMNNPEMFQWLREATPYNFKKYLKHRPYCTGKQIFYTDGCDFVGKLENLQQDFNTVCDRIGIPRQQLPHRNMTEHKHYTEYYDDETRDIITTIYKEEIQKFGYVYGE